jgi:superfamily II RNA helicase
MASRPLPELLRRVPQEAPLSDPGAILDRFLDWVSAAGLEPYPAQQEALLEIASGKHVVLDTPTGSGKSLVALGMHFQAMCQGRRSFYTAPIKALVSEKFFALCDLFGAENVGMLTGDASINWAAPVICCTAEVLSNMALRQGERTDAPYVVMDEFHYFGDRERGVAWQVPLLLLPHSTFLLMSATLGNTAHIEERLRDETGREVAHVWSDQRPVPLDYEYRETPIQETVEELLEQGRAPIYVVNFTQRECAELAQALTSARIASREQRTRIAEALGEFRFDTPYGRDLKRFLSAGIGLHHAGLLPKYRLLVEQLSQQGHLRVICGTDTLGVGVNIPIRTVLLSRLSKFDGEKVRLLQAREFKQITGRAGRRGFDVQGSVVAQAPEHAIENKRRAERRPQRGRREAPKRRPPEKGFVPWSRDTFEELIKRPPERLVSQFRVDHGMLLSVLQRDAAEARGDAPRHAAGPRGGYAVLADLIARCHESAARKRRLRREAAVLFRSLRRSGVVRVERRAGARGAHVLLSEELQRDFSLYQSLSLYLVEAIAVLDPEEPRYALELLSLVEAVVENPEAILRAQVRKLRRELLEKLKAQRVPFEERGARLDEVTYPKPDEEFIEQTFAIFAEGHPWVGRDSVQPKAIAREMALGFQGFDSYVRQYELQRVEGLLLRYLGNVYSTLQRSVPDARKTDEVHDILAYLRTLIARVDSSLLEEWESLLHPAAQAARAEPPRLDLALTPQALRARVRSELHALVRALAQGDYEEAARWVRQDPGDPWDAARFARELAPLLAEHGGIVFDPEARKAHYAVLKPTGPRSFDVAQALLDARGENLWAIHGEVDLAGAPEGPLVRVRRIGP